MSLAVTMVMILKGYSLLLYLLTSGTYNLKFCIVTPQFFLAFDLGDLKPQASVTRDEVNELMPSV